jgi:hypothetical protein
MEQSPKPSQTIESYVYDGYKLNPEGTSKGINRTQLSSMVHGRMTVSDTTEWDEVMHPQVNGLKIGETTVLTSGAYEYIKVTKISDNSFDTEYGTYDYED